MAAVKEQDTRQTAESALVDQARIKLIDDRANETAARARLEGVAALLAAKKATESDVNGAEAAVVTAQAEVMRTQERLTQLLRASAMTGS
jgi:hypothetical protein